MKKYLLIIVFCCSLFFVFGESAIAQTALEKFNTGRDIAANEMGYVPSTERTLSEIIAVAIKAILTLLGIVFLVLMIYGGFKWMKASGRESDVESAKKIIENAIIGLILVFGAYALTVFISSGLVTAATGV